MLAHIVSRFLLHVFASTSIYLAAYFLVGWLYRRHWDWGRLILPGVIVLALMTPNEVYDVAFGKDPFVKAVFDLISWVVGAGLSAWGVKRLASAQ